MPFNRVLGSANKGGTTGWVRVASSSLSHISPCFTCLLSYLAHAAPLTLPCPCQPQEQYVNDTDFLLAAAAAAGLPRDAAAAALNEAGPGEALVQQELGKFSGMNGVPHFVVNGRCAEGIGIVWLL